MARKFTFNIDEQNQIAVKEIKTGITYRGWFNENHEVVSKSFVSRNKINEALKENDDILHAKFLRGMNIWKLTKLLSD